jgi:4-diphosphocytidyl-2-C-methyl-D-erythritol kinase
MNLKSYAKINFDLQIVGKKDNMHLLSSFAFPISLYDDIILETNNSGKTKIECDNLEIPLNQDNTCYKVIELLRKEKGFKEGVRVKIIKRIPTMAGLGGGSSNAAAVLKGLNELLNLKLNPKELMGIAYQVGSDVPFFVRNKPAIILETGSKTKAVKADLNFHILLIKPRGGVSTKEAYNLFDKTQEISVQKEIDYSDFKTAFEQSKNDLEEPAKSLCPDIRNVIKDLQDLGLTMVRMSGSGSCVYALSKDRQKLMVIKEELKTKYPFVMVVHPLI